jgi:hypothetical protein
LSGNTLIDQLIEIAAREPLPRIDVGLTDRNRISLDHWTLERDCLIGYGPGGSARFLIPLAHVVIIEIMH